MHTFHLTQLLSSHKSHNSSHTTHLTQLISHNSTLSRAAFVWHLVELLRVLSLNFTQVLSHNSSHNSHNSSHTTPLISQLTQLISRISAHLTTNTTHFTQLLSSRKYWSWKSSACKCSTARKMMRLLCVCRHRNMNLMNLINSPHPTGNWSWKSSACKCSTARKMMRLLCVCRHRNMNLINSPHPTPPVADHERAVPVSALREERWWGCCACVCIGTWTLSSHPTPPHPPNPPHPPHPPHWMAGSQHQCARMTALCARMTRFLCARMTRLQCAQMTRFQCAQMTRWPLQRLQAASPAPELETLEHLTLAELRGEKITFGKTHAGKTFEDVWLTYWPIGSNGSCSTSPRVARWSTVA